MDYKYQFEKYNKEGQLTKDQFNHVVNYLEVNGKLKPTFKFHEMVYSFYQGLEKEGKLQKQLIADVKDEFRVSSVTIFSVLKWFRESLQTHDNY